MGTENGTDQVTGNQLERQVVVLSFPVGTHSIPLLNVACRLALAAPNLTFSYFSTSKSNLSIFGSKCGYQVLSNLKAYDVSDGIPEGYKFTGKPFEEVELFITPMVENFRKAIDDILVESTTTTMEKEKKKKISCVISDGFMGFAGEIAEEMGVPWIYVWPASTFSLSTSYYMDQVQQHLDLANGGTIAGREEERIDFIPALSLARVKDMPGIVLHDPESIFARMLRKSGQMVPRATAVILNSFEEVEHPLIFDDLKSICQNVLTLGPLSLPSPSSQSYVNYQVEPKYNDCLTWLDTQNPTSVAFISFGTITAPPPHELAALAEGLEESGVPFLWSLKESMQVHLPNWFLERTSGRGLVAAWVPQKQVLEHIAIGVSVTHCGWNSVMESIMAGIPMIGRPMFGDHMVNCITICDIWGVGIKMKDEIITKEGTMESLDLIFSNEEGKKIREKVGALRGTIKHVIGPNGSRNKNFNTLLEIVCSENPKFKA